MNRREVENLSTGLPLKEYVDFPGKSRFAYTLESVPSDVPLAEFREGTLRIVIPAANVRDWASTDAIGMYFELAASGSLLKLAIEKDLECVDGPLDERDPDAFPRSVKSC